MLRRSDRTLCLCVRSGRDPTSSCLKENQARLTGPCLCPVMDHRMRPVAIPEELDLSRIDRTLGGSVQSLPPERPVSRNHARLRFLSPFPFLTRGATLFNLNRWQSNLIHFCSCRHQRPRPLPCHRVRLCPSRCSRDSPRRAPLNAAPEHNPRTCPVSARPRASTPRAATLCFRIAPCPEPPPCPLLKPLQRRQAP